jgi:hypothetical protein
MMSSEKASLNFHRETNMKEIDFSGKVCVQEIDCHETIQSPNSGYWMALTHLRIELASPKQEISSVCNNYNDQSTIAVFGQQDTIW